MKYSIIIPCYNEEENLQNLVDAILPLTDRAEFVLVENGSKDGSRRFFRESIENRYENIVCAYVDVNQGYGYGLQQGILASGGEYVGWIHADLQIPPESLLAFFDRLDDSGTKNILLKGSRQNRPLFDRFFTAGQAVFNSLLFKEKLSDIGAIPVLFPKKLAEETGIDNMPNDFSIELFVYHEAVKRGFRVERIKVTMRDREHGSSSWSGGIKSKIRQSKRIFRDSIKISRGEKVL